MDDDDEILFEAARVIQTEAATVQMTEVMRRALPLVLAEALSAVARRFEVEIVALHNRIDQEIDTLRTRIDRLEGR